MTGIPRKVVLVQLPIPPVGGEPIRGNIPLAAGYLKRMAHLRGLEDVYDIEILPARVANNFGDQALVRFIAGRRPWLVGFSCYLWNIDRSLWIAEQLKRICPTQVVVGGPEVTVDNSWVVHHPSVDFSVVGEGEQTFVELLEALRTPRSAETPLVLPGLVERDHERPFVSRKPLAVLDEISSPYLHGILDAADEEMLLLETIRGCVFKCKFCFYPKSYDGLYFLSREKTLANLQHAAERGVREVVLLDPTLNQRRDFAAFLRLLIEGNPDRRFKYFGELRAEGITPEIAQLLRTANFPEVEIGLQSIDPQAMDLMDRRNNMKAFQRGVTALLDMGIEVKVDLIIGLPGDTVESVRRGMHYLRDSGLYTSVQVFNLAILPGTAFRDEASGLGLRYSPRTPYYVTSTPTLSTQDLYELMAEAQELFGVEFDPLPPPILPPKGEQYLAGDLASAWHVDLDDSFDQHAAPPAEQRSFFFILWMRAANFAKRERQAFDCVRRILSENPHTTLQIVLELTDPAQRPECDFLRRLWCVCLEETSYLDRFYSILPGAVRGAKRVVIVSNELHHHHDFDEWLDEIDDYATVVASSDATRAEGSSSMYE